MDKPLSILFFGSPDFAVRSLEALRANPRYRVEAVVTETDKPAGRGKKLKATAVKEYALTHGLTILQPRSIRREFVEHINSQEQFDAFVVVAYGKIIPQAILDTPKYSINVHGSLLPRWRGAAPIHRAIMAGDSKTGVAIMKMEAALDTGPVYASEETTILPDDTFGSIHDRLANLGANLLADRLEAICNKEIAARAQDEEGIVYADKWLPQDFRIDWQESAEVCNRRIRTCSPFPGARCSFRGKLCKIFAAKIVADQNFPMGNEGTAIEANSGELIIRCGGNSFLSVLEIQLAGKKRITIADFMKGYSIPVGEAFN
ncbi:UNVERIFIED_CONTAM: hypothetical protein GTU68_052040 [Idotea baltica]|nr:hypothetical protein [Idotea baltica]